MYITVFPFATSTGSFGCTYSYLPSDVFVNTGALFVISFSFTPVMNFLNAKSNFLSINFSKSSSSCCPAMYVSPRSISVSLYSGNVSSVGNTTFDFCESLSIIAFPFLSVKSVISAIFVIFSYKLILSFTLHLILTSI